MKDGTFHEMYPWTARIHISHSQVFYQFLTTILSVRAGKQQVLTTFICMNINLYPNTVFSHSAKIFQKTKCNMCNSPLELPSVHFLCSHSFHQHCFESYAESEAECPTCTPENRKIMDMLRAQDQKRDLHDHFNRQVTILELSLVGS